MQNSLHPQQLVVNLLENGKAKGPSGPVPRYLCKIFPIFCALLLGLSFFLRPLEGHAQTTADLGNIHVEELTDDQVRQLVTELDRQGITDEQMERTALDRGMSPVELVKLKTRIREIRKAASSANPAQTPPRPSANSHIQDSISALEQRPVSDYSTAFAMIRPQNFGYGLFNNPRLTFEPNLRLPTPKNYQLAADDELLIDVSGYSEANYRLRISPEGVIRIPVAGAINVNGMTIEQAKKVITQRLASTVYSDIRTGKTTVEVGLGAIRTIKVTIIGEATLPGTYSLPSLASAYNALYACGGPNVNGSYRDIQVIRNNATVAVIDVYKYLVEGSKINDIRLMDQDIIKINTYSVRIELKGEVKKPGLYDVLPGETLAVIFGYAGGFTDNAYTARLRVFKNTDKDREVTTIGKDELGQVMPGRGDTYIVGKILNRFANRINISGAVYRPGEYELKAGMTLRQLIAEADGLREDAFPGRATLHRLKSDLSPEIVSFDVDKLLAGQQQDIVLRREDKVEIYSKFDLKEGYFVDIQGEVSNPGTFLYEEGITVEDLILLSGGLKEGASVRRIEISRRIKNADSLSADIKTAVIFRQDVRSDLRDSSGAAKFVLQPFDQVYIYPAPGYFVQQNSVVEGEVVYPGKYTLQAKGDRISDLVARAGGLAPNAYLPGAVLVRTRHFTRIEQNNAETGLDNLLKQNSESGSSPALQNQLVRNAQRRSETVGIDLQKIMSSPHSEYDLLLDDGDTLRIPKQLQTVRVNGEVLYPTLVRYNKNYGFKDYIIGAGGFSDRSARRKSYVVNANGSVKGTRSFLFFKHYPEVRPGAEIYVPLRKERQPLRAAEIVSLLVSLATLLLISYNSFHK
jgi:protein involved in polysaccharide export with SLBB domain